MKLNFDGSVCASHKADAGFVIRDHNGHSLVAVSTNLGYSDVLSVKAQALKHGLLHLASSTSQSVFIQGDSKTLLDGITAKAQCP